MENPNNCETCKFYNKYYKIFAARLVYANCGTCKNAQINVNTARKILRNKLPCEYFEQTGDAPTVSKDEIENIFNEMKLRLDEIALLLKND